MKIKIWITGLALMAGLGVGKAQNNDIWVSGRVITAPFFNDGHRLLFSQHDNVYGTARSAAMGGAFTSLGADLSSMNINPAGLGMYQSSDLGFTQALTVNGMNTTAPYMSAGSLASGGSRIAYGLNNIGAVYNVFNGSGAITSVSLGFSYNRAANFNSRTTIETFGENSTIGDMFARQLNLMVGEGLPAGALEPSADPWRNEDIFLDEWGAVLGLHTDVVGLDDNGRYGYYTDAIPSDSYFRSVTKGGINEYSVSAGANLSNVLYFGATLGITDISYTENTLYEEQYGPGMNTGNMWFDQATRITGSGVSAKLGVTVRPVEPLRIGVAFHLPTYYSLEKVYAGRMGAGSHRSDTGDMIDDAIRLNSAPRLMAGISGVIADRAILALDGEVAWYNKISTRSDYREEVEEVKNNSKLLYKPAYTLRAGLEYLLSDVASLRAGGAYMMDFMRSTEFDPGKSDNPAMRDGFNVTAGVGFNIGRNGYLDVAYVYNRARMTDYDLWFYDDGSNIASQYDVVGSQEFNRNYTSTRNRHMITLTLGNRF